MSRKQAACCDLGSAARGKGTVADQSLQNVPRSQKWTAVVEEVLDGSGLLSEDAPRVAAAVLEAAGAALMAARDDAGLRYTFYLLTQVALAAREPDWHKRLAAVGIPVDDRASVFELTAGLQAAVDDYVDRHGRVTDAGEMAQQAAGEALASLTEASTNGLFGTGGEQLRSAVRQLSTESGFAALGQRFFGRFLSRFLSFYLSRITADKVGSERLGSISEVTRFDDALARHCDQSALVVREFCRDWYSKTEYTEQINPGNTSRFMAYALEKLSLALAMQRAGP
jgi:hypothetical protein